VVRVNPEPDVHHPSLIGGAITFRITGEHEPNNPIEADTAPVYFHIFFFLTLLPIYNLKNSTLFIGGAIAFRITGEHEPDNPIEADTALGAVQQLYARLRAVSEHAARKQVYLKGALCA